MKTKRRTINDKRKTNLRPSWDDYFLGIADLVSKRSTCLRRRVGAVLVKDKRMLATGYNGAPSRIAHCSEAGCIREKLKIPSGERHELCLAPGEEILTSEGFVPIEDIKVGRRVLTHKGVYRTVTHVFKRRYSGDLCYVEPYNLLPVALTPQHPILAIKTKVCQFDTRTLCKEICKSVNKAYCCKPYLEYKSSWIPAGKLKSRDIVMSVFDDKDYLIDWLDLSFLADAPMEYHEVIKGRESGTSYKDIQFKLNVWPSTAYNWAHGGAPRNTIILRDNLLKHGSSPSKSMPAGIKLTNEALRLIGLYLAEGCSNSNQLSFSFHKKEKDLINEVKSTMKRLFGLDCYEDIRRNSHKIVYSSVILARAFKILFGNDAYTKKIPNMLMRLSPEKQRFIIDAYAQEDGYKIDENTTTTTTASKTLALQETQILLRLGYLPVINMYKEKYRVIWKNGIKIRYGYLKDNKLFSPIRKIYKAHFEGHVYNLEVKTDNSYVTKSFIVHNCRGLHAEQNAFLQAALHGTSLKDAVLYSTTQPCIICAKMVINAGIREIVIKGTYPDKMAREILKEAKIKVRTVR